MESNIKPPIYPAYCNPLSPTNSGQIWPPLFAADVQALRQENGFEGQNIFFHLNHPIKFVCLTGVIVDVASFSNSYTGRHIIITLDDSSGETIDAMIKLAPTQQNDNGNHHDPNIPSLEEAKASFKEFKFDDLDSNIGKIVKASGILDMYRGRMQFNLRRYTLVRDSNIEVKLWEKTVHFKKNVLAKPWQLTDEQVRMCREEAETTESKEERRRRRRRKEAKRAEAKLNVPHKTSPRKPLDKKADTLARNANTKKPRAPPLRASIKPPKTFPDKSAGWAEEGSTKPMPNPQRSTTPVPAAVRITSANQNGKRMSNGTAIERWICPSISCEAYNFPNETNCSRCGMSRIPFVSSNNLSKKIVDPAAQVWAGERSKPVSSHSSHHALTTTYESNSKPRSNTKASITPASRTQEENKANVLSGDWKCSCGCHNWARNTECFKCLKPNGSAKKETTTVESKPQVLSGDWTCSCGWHNFATKSQCSNFKCMADKPTSSQLSPGDWHCCCGAHNYARNSECFRCMTPKPRTSNQSARIEPKDTRKQMPTTANFKSGDWICICGKHNFASRAMCTSFGCSMSRPKLSESGSSAHPAQTSSREPMKQTASHVVFRAADWICDTCGNHNFASKAMCTRFGCSTSRPR